MTFYAPITVFLAVLAYLSFTLNLSFALAKPLLLLPSEFSYLAHVHGSPAIPEITPRQDGQPVFPDQPPSCPICEQNYGSIDSCAQAAPVLANFSMVSTLRGELTEGNTDTDMAGAIQVIFNPGAFIDVIKCACADTFQSGEWYKKGRTIVFILKCRAMSAYPQCVDWYVHGFFAYGSCLILVRMHSFIQTNQTQFLNSSNLPGVVDGIRKICALESSLLGGVATADGEVTPTTSLNVPKATGTANGDILISASFLSVTFVVASIVFAGLLQV
ncbi:hypothetical protein BN946_scf184989.g25 [Trametes cinnabarina]|uniref:Uncharacterized protein n=1 Tax=Pycnoporus cinnabarinus TaxID=5643 RepID=A0A060S903_PYCCI|nr:hypothetical protein BN946_scf184989.g25 [Trametes cinnabarina]